MTQGRLIASLLASLALLGGCGSEEGGPSDREVAARSLLSLRDLPEGATTADALPTGLCAPVPILERHGAIASESQMFAFERVQVQEAVGVLPNPDIAGFAYRDLSSNKHHECIRGAVESFGPERNATVKLLPPRGLGLGDEDAFVRYLIVRPGEGPVSYIDFVSIRSGKSVAVLILLSRRNPSDAVVREVAGTVARKLANASA